MAEMMDVTEDKADPAEEIRITFLFMGQGDCVLISCPDGKRILVDSGSTGSFGDTEWLRAHMQLRSDDGVGKRGGLDALILTHPDMDHCNQIASMLRGFKIGATTLDGDEVKEQTTSTIAVNEVYFSSAPVDDRSPLAAYAKSGASDTIYNLLGVKRLHLVRLNETTSSVRTWKWDAEGKPAEDIPLKAGEMVVASGTTAKKKRAWSVRIIAGCVAKSGTDDSDAGGRNARSLVTLLQLGTEKALLCGDATASTERFLVASRNALISDVVLLQAPHHGSSRTSSTPAFVTAAKPKSVAVSVDLIEYSHHLPGKAAIDLYLATVQDVASHKVDAWQRDPSFRKGTTNQANLELDRWRRENITMETKQSKVDDEPVSEGPHYIRADQEDVENVFVALSPAEGYLCYRVSSTKDIQLTGLNGQVDYLTYALNGE
jgi:beta-lactamase superfamily II metal-dependent hydrolase